MNPSIFRRGITRAVGGGVGPSVLLAFCFTFGTDAAAAVAGVAGSVELIPPPPSVAVGTFENDAKIFVFAERTDTRLPRNVTADIRVPGTYGPNGNATDYPQATIAAGTVVSSYYVHADKQGSSEAEAVILDGAVTFDETVVAVQFVASSRAQTNSLLGSPSTVYDTTTKLEIYDPGRTDQVVISSDARTVSFHLEMGAGADDLRILTEQPLRTPLLNAPAVLLSALVLLGTGFGLSRTRPKATAAR
jgi:hypothetical protein